MLKGKLLHHSRSIIKLILYPIGDFVSCKNDEGRIKIDLIRPQKFSKNIIIYAYVNNFCRSRAHNSKVALLTFQCGTSFVDPFLLSMFHDCHAFLSVYRSLVVTCRETADLLALLYVMLYCILSLSHVVSWIRCGALLYLFVIFASFLTLSNLA